MKKRTFILKDDFDDGVGFMENIRNVIEEDPFSDITIEIESFGGSVFGLLSMIDYLKTLKCDICTICRGYAMSAGFMMLVCGTKGKRYALNRSIGMYHQLSGGVGGKYGNIKDSMELIDWLNRELSSNIIENTNFTEDDLRLLDSRDIFLTASEMLEKGAIDHIIESNNEKDIYRDRIGLLETKNRSFRTKKINKEVKNEKN